MKRKLFSSPNDGSVEMTQIVCVPLLFLMTKVYWGEQSKCPLPLALKRRVSSSTLTT